MPTRSRSRRSRAGRTDDRVVRTTGSAVPLNKEGKRVQLIQAKPDELYYNINQSPLSLEDLKTDFGLEIVEKVAKLDQGDDGNLTLYHGVDFWAALTSILNKNNTTLDSRDVFKYITNEIGNYVFKFVKGESFKETSDLIPDHSFLTAAQFLTCYDNVRFITARNVSTAAAFHETIIEQFVHSDFRKLVRQWVDLVLTPPAITSSESTSKSTLISELRLNDTSKKLFETLKSTLERFEIGNVDNTEKSKIGATLFQDIFDAITETKRANAASRPFIITFLTSICLKSLRFSINSVALCLIETILESDEKFKGRPNTFFVLTNYNPNTQALSKYSNADLSNLSQRMFEINTTGKYNPDLTRPEEIIPLFHNLTLKPVPIDFEDVPVYTEGFGSFHFNNPQPEKIYERLFLLQKLETLRNVPFLIVKLSSQKDDEAKLVDERDLLFSLGLILLPLIENIASIERNDAEENASFVPHNPTLRESLLSAFSRNLDPYSSKKEVQVPIKPEPRSSEMTERKQTLQNLLFGKNKDEST